MDAVTRVQGQQRTMLTGDGDTRLVRRSAASPRPLHGSQARRAITCPSYQVRGHD